MSHYFTSSLSKKGFSLIEMLLVLGVLSVLLIGAFIVYPKVRDNQRAKTEAENITLIQANVRNLFLNKGGDYTGLGWGKDASNGGDRGISNIAKVFPTSMNNGDFSRDVQIKSSWGGDVWVWARPAISVPGGQIGAERSFGISYEGVPANVCVNLLPLLAGKFESVYINFQELVLPGGGFDINNVGTSCVDNATLRLTST